MINCLLIMLGGGIGAVIRGFITNFCNHKFNSKLPVATPIVNIGGSFIIGLLLGSLLKLDWIEPFLIVGILGGLTTFSTLSSELVQLLMFKKKFVYFITYSALQYGVSFLACLLGYIL
ncbi:fluoride efflux transporter FluC [Staphylococcus shinii]|uniref:fluoride efflux transporter FluC n=1 Tax=Staphylococcus shinii TaxID=2912228 RepID=UPI0008535078|nr:CrcB family protein [Staphylococcus shinii]OEK90474.1 camphor resistance protein CrcB [Staphylococcus shinii]PTH96512.1 CrcB family protein [Staphylococcus shinii]QRA17695.1 CrcB family protein [Staphylococcus shinii]RIM96488.1 CrcB family protein [Staphylococcus shinii]